MVVLHAMTPAEKSNYRNLIRDHFGQSGNSFSKYDVMMLLGINEEDAERVLSYWDEVDTRLGRWWFKARKR